MSILDKAKTGSGTGHDGTSNPDSPTKMAPSTARPRFVLLDFDKYEPLDIEAHLEPISHSVYHYFGEVRTSILCRIKGA